MKQNENSESRKMLKLLKDNRVDSRAPRSMSEYSKSPRDKRYEKATNVNSDNGMYLYSWGLSDLVQQSNKHTISYQLTGI